MTKAEIIHAISIMGDHYGGHGGVLDLLTETGKTNTQEVTAEEAVRFLERRQSDERRVGSGLQSRA